MANNYNLQWGDEDLQYEQDLVDATIQAEQQAEEERVLMEAAAQASQEYRDDYQLVRAAEDVEAAEALRQKPVQDENNQPPADYPEIVLVEDANNNNYQPLANPLPFRLIQTRTDRSRKYGFVSTSYRVIFEDNAVGRLPHDAAIQQFFEGLLHQVGQQDITVTPVGQGTEAATVPAVRRVSPTDLVRFSFNHPGLKDPINLPFTVFNDATVERITTIIAKTLQSNEDFHIDNELEINVVVQPRYAGGRRTTHVQFDNIEAKIAAKRCVVQIKNRDSLCMARALVVTKAKIDNDPAYEAIRKGDLQQYQGRNAQQRNAQRSRAVDLCRAAGTTLNGPHNIADMAVFQAHLHKYRIIAVEATNDRIIFDGGFERGCSNVLGLLHHANHYHALNNVAAWFEGKFFCYGCCSRYAKQGQHRCALTCSRCLGTAHDNVDANRQANQYKCNDCLLSFLTRNCYEQHLQVPDAYRNQQLQANRKRTAGDSLNPNAVGKTVCSMKRVCPQCKQYYNGYEYATYGKVHECGKHRCFSCKDMVNLDTHLCYMQPKDKCIADIGLVALNEADEAGELPEEPQGTANGPPAKRARQDNTPKPTGPHKFVYWDTETRQDDAGGLHVPNLFVAQVTCEMCIDQPNNAYKQCKMHTDSDLVFRTTDEFGRFVMAQRNATFIAHNFKGYDSQFILDFCRSNGVTPEVIMNGSKCTYLQLPVQKVRFVDSLNFLPMALAKIPETFGFEEMRKGHFPHYFNTLVNANYNGPLPAKEMYGYTYMKPDQRKAFDQWYDREVERGTQFNMQTDLLSYCENDVTVLRIGCSRFRRLLIDIGNTDPFKESVTIASCAQLIFRKLFLRPYQIGIVPPSGYRPLANQSKKALQWLSWVAHKQNIEIRDSRHPEGEYKVDNYAVDGFNQADNMVYEFLGSYWHGDPSAFNFCTFNRRLQCPMGILYERTQRRQQDIERAGYRYESIWESEWDTLVKRDIELRNFLEEAQITGPLDPRDAFFGGRTNASRLYYKQPEDESSKVHYVDFCSLYPSVNKYCKYPLGHPEIIMDPPNGIDAYFGLAKCTVLPPRNLFHPVLPYRHPDGKLMFPLCIKCADMYSQTPCTHTEVQRSWTGTWATIELQHAVEQGYQILKIFEVWHFERTTQYNSNEPGSGLFADYVNRFIKIKQEASGLPPGIETDEAVQAYLAEFQEREGVLMERDKIALNNGLRFTAKLFLNSLWGKFGQRSNLPRTEFVRTVDELNRLLLRQDIEVSDLIEFKGPTLADDICQVQYKLKTDFADELPSTNIFIAVFTTAHARLKLLRAMEPLDRRVIYYDTDSIVYESRQGDEEPPTGSFLGELTHELKPGDYIVEFFSGGPKNYGYKTKSGKTVQKHKGITLTANAMQQLSFEAAKRMIVDNTVREALLINLQQIRRERHATALRTVELRKKYQFHYDKRVISANFVTLPYGHVDIQ
jgi:hypothetical protein